MSSDILAQLAHSVQFPYAPCGAELSARRAAHPLSMQARMNRPLPGIGETQCPGCGVLTLGPRAGWTPATYDPRGLLIPVAFNAIEVPRSAPCHICAWVDGEVVGILRQPRHRASGPARIAIWLNLLGLRPAVVAFLLAQVKETGIAA